MSVLDRELEYDKVNKIPMYIELLSSSNHPSLPVSFIYQVTLSRKKSVNLFLTQYWNQEISCIFPEGLFTR